MRLRTLLFWLLLPGLLGVVLAGWFVARTVGHERGDFAAVPSDNAPAVALSPGAVADANAWIGSEITNLLALDAFGRGHGALDGFQAGARAAVRNMDRDQLLASLETADAQGARTVEQLNGEGTLPAAVRLVLNPLASKVIDDVRSGRTGFVDPAPYVTATNWAREQRLLLETTGDTGDTSVGVGRGEEGRGDETPYWRDGAFVGFMLGLAAIVVGGTLIAVWRISACVNTVSNRLSLEQQRAEDLHKRGVRLHQIIQVGRRLSTETDVDSLSRTLIDETRSFVGGDLVTLARRDGTQVVPTFTKGELAVCAVAVGQGAIGSCVDNGTAVRTVVQADPMLAEADGPFALLAAPLVTEGRIIGALVVASRSATPFDETSEMALHVLVLLAAGAVTAAERLGSTLALTLHDPLTGLANRRKLDRDLDGVAAGQSGVAFMMVDIDHFKSFNDDHGHQRGDEMLRTVSAAITAAVRADDVVYRYGGEEFSVLLRDTDLAVAGTIAERVRAEVRAATAREMGSPVTVSIGVAAQNPPVVRGTLVEHADAALYAAKQAGRDRVRIRSARREASNRLAAHAPIDQ